MGQSFVIIRHGDYQQWANCPSALQPWALTARGVSQAKEAGAALASLAKVANLCIGKVMHCSTSLRAWQTAQLASQALGNLTGDAYTLEESEALCERSVGALANLTTEQIEQALAKDPRTDSLPSDWKTRPTYRLPVPGAESLQEAGHRVAAYIQSVLQRAAHAESNATPVFVGHGAAFRHAMVEMGILSLDALPSLSMHHAHPMLLTRHHNNAAWQLAAGEWKLRGKSHPLD